MCEVVAGTGECGVADQAKTGSAGLLENKKSCIMASNKDCVMCDSAVGEEDRLIFWWVVGNLREIGRCCWKIGAELWGPESE